MAGHSFPFSLGLPRWRPCQIPDPGATLKCQNPYPGEGTLSQFSVGSPPCTTPCLSKAQDGSISERFLAMRGPLTGSDDDVNSSFGQWRQLKYEKSDPRVNQDKRK